MTIQERIEANKAELAKLEGYQAVEAKEDTIKEGIRKALSGVEDAEKLLGFRYVLAYWVGGEAGWEIQFNDIELLKAKRAPGNSKAKSNGDGKAPNFNGNRVKVSLKIQKDYGLAPEYDSIRKVALAVGIPVEDRHPDQTLRKDFKDIYEGLTKIVDLEKKAEEKAKVEEEELESMAASAEEVAMAFHK